MAFEKKGIEVMDARLNLRLPQSELSIIKENASMAGISVSEMVRARYFGKKIVANTDLAMIRQLLKIGGLLKLVHTESRGAYSKDTAAVLGQLGDLIDKLSKKAGK